MEDEDRGWRGGKMAQVDVKRKGYRTLIGGVLDTGEVESEA